MSDSTQNSTDNSQENNSDTTEDSNSNSDDSSNETPPSTGNICDKSTTVFCEDFEAGTFAKWDDGDKNPAPSNQIIINEGPLQKSNNHVARLQALVHQRSYADLVKVLPKKYDHLYLRYYQKFENGFDFTVGNHTGGGMYANRNKLGVDANLPNGSDYFWFDLEFYEHNFHLYTYYHGMYQDCTDTTGACWGDQFPCSADEGSNFCEKPQHRELAPTIRPEDNKWYCIEIETHMGAAVLSEAQATGYQNFWIDNVAQGPFQNLWIRTSSQLQLEGIWIAGFFHEGQGNSAGILYDDIVVSTERIGCAKK